MTSSNLKPFEQWANRSAFLFWLLKWPFMRFHPKKIEQFHFITECLETPANGFSSPMSTCFFHGAALLVCLPHRENLLICSEQFASGSFSWNLLQWHQYLATHWVAPPGYPQHLESWEGRYHGNLLGPPPPLRRWKKMRWRAGKQLGGKKWSQALDFDCLFL